LGGKRLNSSLPTGLDITVVDKTTRGKYISSGINRIAKSGGDMTGHIEALKARLADIGNLRRAAAVLEWDLQTCMPPGGAKARSEQLALLSRLAHEQFVAEETRRLLERAESEAQGRDPDSDEARLIRNVRRDFDRAVKIPTALAAEMAGHAALSQEVWAKARAGNDFAAFAPSLDKMMDLVRQAAACLGYEDDPYDPLLDQFEPGAKTAAVAATFAELRPQLVALTRDIVQASEGRQETLPEGPYPVAAQNAFTKRIVQAIGYDMARGRQDQAPHPFCTSFSRDDVRITTRFSERHLEMALYASLHEMGHALYEQGMRAEWDNTPLDSGASSGFHESQSRLWENLVGRSRAFCSFIFPQIQAAFPEALAGVTAERFHRAVNRVEPSLIRVEADEVTYNLHILLRFELERELLADRLKVADLPEVWNAKMQEYLGVTPTDDAHGVLQDIHWSAGMVGYFPTYALGNLMSAQLWRALRQELPDLDAQIGRGEFAPLLKWLRVHVHACGRKYMPDELIRRVTGEPLNARYFVEYLRGKFGDLYGLKR
jgi:carboxypeptidase Taq